MRFFSFFLPLLLLSCTMVPSSHEGRTKITLQSGEEEIPLWVEIADDPSEQEHGLMERTVLPQDEGMLFIFSEQRMLSFWMKNTLIPLDILFFDASGIFINVQTMDPCKTDPCAIYSSDKLATYALELSAGFYEQKLRPLQENSGGVLRLRFPEE